MNVIQQIEQAAERAVAVGTGPWTVDETIDGVHFVCELQALESLACAFTRFQLTNAAWKAKTMDDVKRIAASLAQRLTYLLEPIKPIEADAEHCIVQMRSNPPRKDEDRTTYYELQVARGGALSLCRYEKQSGDARHAVPVQVTREVFRHLLADFVAAG
jgi:hypothetical protein